MILTLTFSRPHTAVSYPPRTENDNTAEPTPFDLESFLQFDSQLDLGYLLGLPGDNPPATMNGSASLGNFGMPGFSGEFGFGIDNLGSSNGMANFLTGEGMN